MNLKNVSLKLLSVVMTLVLLLSICAPTISALTPHDHDHDHEEALLDAIVDIIGVVNSADIEASLNELFAMIAELGEEYAPEAWDKIVASGILDDVSDSAKAIQDEAASQMTEIEQTVKAELEKQIKILKDEINAQRVALEEAIEKAAQEMIDEYEELIEQLEGMVEELEAAVQELEAAKAELEKLQKEIEDADVNIEKALADLKALADEAEALVKSNLTDEELKAELKVLIADVSAALDEAYGSMTVIVTNMAVLAYVFEIEMEGYVASLEEIANDCAANAAEALETALTDVAADVAAVVEAEMNKLNEKFTALFDEFIVDALSGEYVVDKDSYYVAVGSEPLFADLLAEAVYLDSKYDIVDWAGVSAADLIKADLITLSYNENELSNFAITQALGYVSEYINGDLRASADAYTYMVVTEILAGLVTMTPETKDDCLKLVEMLLDDTITEFEDEYVGNATVSDMDWATLVGEDNVAYVDEVRAAVKEVVAKAGIIDTLTFEVPVLDYLYENWDVLGNTGKEIAKLDKADVVDAFGENATFTVEVPLADALMFAGEAYLFGYAQFNKKYAEAIKTIQDVNPEATVVVLGHYNAFSGVVLDVNGETVDMGEIYASFAELTSVHPLAYALLLDNVIYVDISEAETEFIAYSTGETASLVNFVKEYLADPLITNVSEAGHEYIKEQILAALTVTCAHSFTTYVPDNNATCTQNGTETAVCDICGSVSDTREIPNSTTDHSFTNYVPNGDATCTSMGTMTAKCDYCDETDTIPGTKLGHSFIPDYTIAGTCQEPGVIIHVCEFCSFTYYEDVVSGMHKPGASATCTEDQVCVYCQTVITPALGHAPVVDVAKEPTCSKTGLTEGQHCLECGEILVAQEVIAKLDHVVVVDKAIAPTCSTTGLTEGSHCAVCGEIFVAQETVAKLAHTEVVDKAVNPTCSSTGLTEGKHCSVCGEVIVAQQTIAKLAHTEVVDKAVAATCQAAGLTEGKHCSVCGETIVAQKFTAKLAHTEIVDKAVAATCTSTGLTEGKRCSVCNEVLVAQQTVAKLAHTEVVDKAVAATCTSTGLTEGKHCSVCNEVLVAQEPVAKLNHTEVVDAAVAPTCTKTGLTEGKHCSVCNAVIVAQKAVATLDHDMGEWEEEEGKRKQTCGLCDYTITQAIPKSISSGTGLIIGISAAVVVVLGGGLFLLLLLLKKKKKA